MLFFAFCAAIYIYIYIYREREREREREMYARHDISFLIAFAQVVTFFFSSILA